MNSHSLTVCLRDSDVEKAKKMNFWCKAFQHDFYISLPWYFWRMQRLQHGFTLPHNSRDRGFRWLLSLKAYRGTIWWYARELAGLFLAESGSCSWISMGILSGVTNASNRPRGRGMDVYKEQAAQHTIRGRPGTCRHVQRNQPLRPFPSLLFCESRKFPDDIAEYFHFPVEAELSDNA